MPKRVEKLNLGDHTLDVEIKRCDYAQFDFSEVEGFVTDLVGGRDYQFDAIKSTLIYLWGGIYTDITGLAKKNFKSKNRCYYNCCSPYCFWIFDSS